MRINQRTQVELERDFYMSRMQKPFRTELNLFIKVSRAQCGHSAGLLRSEQIGWSSQVLEQCFDCQAEEIRIVPSWHIKNDSPSFCELKFLWQSKIRALNYSPEDLRQFWMNHVWLVK